MSSDNNQSTLHRNLALEFLFEANEEIDKQVDEKLIEEVYDLFSDEKNDIAFLRRELSKMIKHGDNLQ